MSYLYCTHRFARNTSLQDVTPPLFITHLKKKSGEVNWQDDELQTA